MDNIKIFFGIAGVFVGGAILLVAPGTLGEELPAHRTIGFATLAFGCLFLAAWLAALRSPGGNLASRLRSLLLAATWLGISVGLVAALYGDVRRAWLLSNEGVDATAVASPLRPCTSTMTPQGPLPCRVELAFDGHRVWVDLPNAVNQGAELAVLYWPNEPTTILEVEPSADTFLAMLSAKSATVIMLLAALALFVAFLVKFADVFRSEQSFDDR